MSNVTYIPCESLEDLELELTKLEWFTDVCTEHRGCIYSSNPDGEQHYFVHRNFTGQTDNERKQ